MFLQEEFFFFFWSKNHFLYLKQRKKIPMYLNIVICIYSGFRIKHSAHPVTIDSFFRTKQNIKQNLIKKKLHHHFYFYIILIHNKFFI